MEHFFGGQMRSSLHGNARHVVMHEFPDALEACARMCALAQTVLDKFPATIYVLGARLDRELLTSWQLVLHDLDKGRLLRCLTRFFLCATESWCIPGSFSL